MTAIKTSYTQRELDQMAAGAVAHEPTEEDRRAAAEGVRKEMLTVVREMPVLIKWALSEIKERWGSEDVEDCPSLRELWCSFNRLIWLLGLPCEEAAFVREAAARATSPGEAYDGLLVFADWLEDALRPQHAEAIRRLVPADGDVLVIRFDQKIGPAERKRLRDSVNTMEDRLRKSGRNVHYVAIGHGWDLDRLSPAQILDSGLVTKRDYLAAIERADALRDENERLRLELGAAEARIVELEEHGPF